MKNLLFEEYILGDTLGRFCVKKFSGGFSFYIKDIRYFLMKVSKVIKNENLPEFIKLSNEVKDAYKKSSIVKSMIVLGLIDPEIIIEDYENVDTKILVSASSMEIIENSVLDDTWQLAYELMIKRQKRKNTNEKKRNRRKNK